MDFASEYLADLPTMSRQQIDSLPFGVVKVSDNGIIELYNATESQLSGVAANQAEGKNFFTQVAPCTNNRIFFGRFSDGVSKSDLNVKIAYTFTYKMRPTNVAVHMFRHNTTATNWILIKKK